jgi:hypothetical protein
MSAISFSAPQPDSGDKVQPIVAPEPVKTPTKKAAPKPDKYKPYDKL